MTNNCTPLKVVDNFNKVQLLILNNNDDNARP
jgi:hypothetical protein